MKYKILFIFILGLGLAWLACLAWLEIKKFFYLEEKFDGLEPIYLNQAQALEFIGSDPDGYVGRFNELDYQARNLTPASPHTYTVLFVNSVIIPDHPTQNQIINSINRANKLIGLISSTNNWINTTKLKDIPWKFIIINTRAIDLGLPHTRWDTIVIHKSIINDSAEFVNTLLHEKLHVYQKLFPEDFDIYLKTNGYERDHKYIDSSIPYRSNPDTDDWVYTREGKIYIAKYINTSPRTIADVQYTPTNTCDYEHPREKAVYDLLKAI